MMALCRVARSTRRLGRDTRGVTVVEFALLIGPLAVLLAGAFDLTYRSYVLSVLQGTLSDAARRASVEDPAFMADGDTTEERIKAQIRDRLSAIAPGADPQVSISNYYEFSGIGNAEKIMTDVNGNGRFDYDDGDCWQDANGNGRFDLDAGREGLGGANDVAFYQVTMQIDRLLPSHLFLGGEPRETLSAQTAFRNQPYSSQAVPAVLCGVAS
ncbi:pilus assembly protein [Novosphingobium sp. YJ-S2-02]|uniref:Pilus assembly protein n=1 Tax=Novosphingobium aureum TaxID=2792964 RepID=A0A931HAV3_9SPHN|nr:TadE/TadG family type IV pilus assembly protein [Novosphingobium aureum]MBH0112086.1 pilus assembly protein [Novosphingobium aureum]